MLYADIDYKNDCENKIKYNDLTQIDINSFTTDYFRVASCQKIYYSEKKNIDTDGNEHINKIYIVKIKDDQYNYDQFYVKNADFCKEIAPKIFKIIILG